MRRISVGLTGSVIGIALLCVLYCKKAELSQTSASPVEHEEPKVVEETGSVSTATQAVPSESPNLPVPTNREGSTHPKAKKGSYREDEWKTWNKSDETSAGESLGADAAPAAEAKATPPPPVLVLPPLAPQVESESYGAPAASFHLPADRVASESPAMPPPPLVVPSPSATQIGAAQESPDETPGQPRVVDSTPPNSGSLPAQPANEASSLTTPATRILWNHWFTDTSTGTERKSLENAAPSTNVFQAEFSLGPYDLSAPLSGTMSAPVSDPFRDLLLKVTATKLAVAIYPFIQGRGLALVERSSHSAKILLDRIRNPRPLPTAGSIEKKAKATEALRVEIATRVVGEGCAIVGFLVANQTLNEPEEVIARQVPVGIPEAQCPSQLVGPAGLSPDGLLTLASTNGRKADAALHIFEMALPRARSSTIAFFSNGKGKYWYWNLGKPLSEYLSDGSGGLLGDLMLARQCPETGDGSCQVNYGFAGRNLRNFLFAAFPYDPARQSDANEALAMLRQLAKSTTRKILYSRICTKDGESVFFPAGLLRLNDSDPSLMAESIAVLAPLPQHDVLPPDTCVGNWRVVIPQKLFPDDFPYPFDKLKNQLFDEDKFATFLTSTVRESTAHADGVLLFAHNLNGNFALDTTGEKRILWSSIRVPLPVGSVGVFASCSVGQILGQDKYDIAPLKALNALGLAGAIIDPFPLEIRPGAIFAYYFAQQLDFAATDTATVTLADLFARTRVAIHADTANRSWEAELDELLIAGNGDIPLCRANP